MEQWNLWRERCSVTPVLVEAIVTLQIPVSLIASRVHREDPEQFISFGYNKPLGLKHYSYMDTLLYQQHWKQVVIPYYGLSTIGKRQGMRVMLARDVVSCFHSLKTWYYNSSVVSVLFCQGLSTGRETWE